MAATPNLFLVSGSGRLATRSTSAYLRFRLFRIFFCQRGREPGYISVGWWLYKRLLRSFYGLAAAASAGCSNSNLHVISILSSNGEEKEHYVEMHMRLHSRRLRYICWVEDYIQVLRLCHTSPSKVMIKTRVYTTLRCVRGLVQNLLPEILIATTVTSGRCECGDCPPIDVCPPP